MKAEKLIVYVVFKYYDTYEGSIIQAIWDNESDALDMVNKNPNYLSYKEFEVLQHNP